jgi:alpha-beta hydrolase superfamily lysophospholipase
MQPLPGVGLRFLSISAIDGFRIAAALWQPLANPAAATTLIVQVHGSGGNFASLPLRATARPLSARGYAALSISTRQHDERVNTDNFFELRRDIEAAVATAKALGYGSLVLQGHSLGTAQVAFYAATDWDPAIRGVILTGAIAKLPWKSRDILIQDEDAYRALAQAARDAVRAGRPEATFCRLATNGQPRSKANLITRSKANLIIRRQTHRADHPENLPVICCGLKAGGRVLGAYLPP